jgi:hypothetical protein
LPSYEEAKHCPKCGQQGKLGKTHTKLSGRPGAKLEEWFCQNERCRWYNTPWVIQLNPDGTIPTYDETGDKMYPVIDLARGERAVEQTQRQTEKGEL